MSNSDDFMTEVASLLGLYSGGEVRPMGGPKTSSRPRLRTLMENPELLTTDVDPSAAVAARLAANYIPSLVQLVTTQLERGWIPTPGANALEDGLGWLGQVILLAVPLTARFVRQYPDETRRLFLALTAYSAEMWFLPASTITISQALFSEMVAQSISPSSTPVLLPHSTRTGLRLAILRLQSKQGFGTPNSLMMLMDLDDPLDLAEAREVNAKSMGTWVYWGCETARQAPNRATRTTACVEEPKGQEGEMQICGGCRSVRYCSRSHQKVDWKRHKSMCFKPTW